MISRALEYALAVNGIKKIDETVPGQRADPAIAAGSKAPRDASPSKRPLGDIILIPLSDAIEVLWNMRGIGFEYGRDVTIPPETRPLQKQPFLWATFRIFLVNFLTLDFIDTVLKLTPPLRSPMGGSIFIPSLPMPTRYLVSTCLHFATGCGIVAGFKMCYSLLTIFGVLVFSHSPSVWPPVFNNPWTASSLHDFWARRWHQVFRHTFMVYGGFPGKWIGELIGGRSLGRVGVVLGTFLASGLFHELGMWAMGQGLDWHVRKFFIIQSFLVLGERAWSRMTGKRVGGWLGCLWVYFAIVVLGQPCGKWPWAVCCRYAIFEITERYRPFSRCLAPAWPGRRSGHSACDQSGPKDPIANGGKFDTTTSDINSPCG